MSGRDMILMTSSIATRQPALERRRAKSSGSRILHRPRRAPRFGAESMLADDAPAPQRAAPFSGRGRRRPNRELIPGAVVTVVVSVHDDGHAAAGEVELRITLPATPRPFPVRSPGTTSRSTATHYSVSDCGSARSRRRGGPDPVCLPGAAGNRSARSWGSRRSTRRPDDLGAGAATDAPQRTHRNGGDASVLRTRNGRSDDELRGVVAAESVSSAPSTRSSTSRCRAPRCRAEPEPEPIAAEPAPEPEPDHRRRGRASSRCCATSSRRGARSSASSRAACRTVSPGWHCSRRSPPSMRRSVRPRRTRLRAIRRVGAPARAGRGAHAACEPPGRHATGTGIDFGLRAPPARGRWRRRTARAATRRARARRARAVLAATSTTSSARRASAAPSARSLEGVDTHAAERAGEALASIASAGAWLMRVTVRRAVDRAYDPLTADDRLCKKRSCARRVLRDAMTRAVKLLIGSRPVASRRAVPRRAARARLPRARRRPRRVERQLRACTARDIARDAIERGVTCWR